MHKVQLGGCNYWLNPLWSNPMHQPGWRWEFPEFLATARHVLSHSGWNEFFETTGAELKRKIQGRKKKLCSRQLQLRWGSALAGGEQHFANWKAEVPISPRADTGTAGMSKYMSQCMGNPMRDWVPGSLSIGNPGRKKKEEDKEEVSEIKHLCRPDSPALHAWWPQPGNLHEETISFPFSLFIYCSSLSYTWWFCVCPWIYNWKDPALFSGGQVQNRGHRTGASVLSHFYFLKLGAYHLCFQNRRARVLWDVVVRRVEFFVGALFWSQWLW